jgi:aryl-alcohol dehydrogenase-like predicted oxidoreductase
MPAPRLWSWTLSPFAGKARIAFAEKAVDVELEENLAAYDVALDEEDLATLEEVEPAGRALG